MTYNLKRYGNTTSVPVNQVITVAGITLPGKNYLAYGEPIDQSLLNIVENFAGPTAPTDAIIGQLWFDTTASAMRYNTGTQSSPTWANVAQSGGNITGGNVTGLTNLSSDNGNIGNLTSANANITGGNVTGLTNLSAATANITTGNITNLISPNANITGGNVTGLTNLSAATANIATGNIGNLISANANITGGNVTGLTNFQSATANITTANITTGNITNLISANANITGGNVTGLTNLAATTANITTGNITNLISANANITGGNVTGLTNLSAGTANIGTGNITNLISANANITGGNVTGLTNLQSANGNIGNLISANANITGGNITNLTNLSATTANIVTGNITNLISANANITGGNVTGLTNLSASLANITTGNITNLISANANITGGNVTGLTNLQSANITGGNVTGNIGGTLFYRTVFNDSGAGDATGAVYNAASNITVSWNTIGAAKGSSNGWANVSGLGPNIPVANVQIAGGTIGQVLSTDGAGNLSWITPVSGTIGNATANVNTALPGGNVGISAGSVANVVVITSTGANIAGTLNATGNANVANIGALNGVFTTVTTVDATASGNIQANTKFVGDNLSTRTGPLTLTATGASNITLATGTGNINLSPTAYITNLKDPVSSQDAATKNYVDLLAQGLKPKASVQCATTAAITLTPPPATIDGHTLVTNDRVLVKNQAAPAENGIYSYNGTNLVRALDADSVAELQDGTFVFIENGTTYSASAFVLISEITTLGTDPITFVQFSTGGTYTAGAGLTLTGTQFSVSAMLFDSLSDVDVSAKVDKESGIMWDATAVSGTVTGQWVSNKIYDCSPTGGASNDF